VRDIRLFGPGEISLAEPRLLKPDEKRTVAPHGVLDVESKPNQDPSSGLTQAVSPAGWPQGNSRFGTNVTIEVGCEVLGHFKRCRTTRRVQVDTGAHRIDEWS
jgi:hypothetical protein